MKQTWPDKVAFCGRMRSGKSTCARYLRGVYPYYTHLAFAAPIKHLLDLTRQQRWTEIYRILLAGPAFSPDQIQHEAHCSRVLGEIIRHWADNRDDDDFAKGKGREFCYQIGYQQLTLPYPAYLVNCMAPRLDELSLVIIDDARLNLEIEFLRLRKFMLIGCQASADVRRQRCSEEELTHWQSPLEASYDSYVSEMDAIIDTTDPTVPLYDKFRVALAEALPKYTRRTTP